MPIDLHEIIRKPPDRVAVLPAGHHIEILIWFQEESLIVSYNPDEYKECYPLQNNQWSYRNLANNRLYPAMGDNIRRFSSYEGNRERDGYMRTLKQLLHAREEYLKHLGDSELLEAEKKLIEGESVLLSIKLHADLIKHFEKIGLIGEIAQNGFCKRFKLE